MGARWDDVVVDWVVTVNSDATVSGGPVQEIVMGGRV